MIQSYFKRTFFIALILFVFQKSSQNIEFTIIEKGEISQNCIEDEGDFAFNIFGNYDRTKVNDNILPDFLLEVETSDEKKIKANCSIKYNSYFLCKIDATQNTLNKVDILLPTKAPNIEEYTFKNWEEVIGAKPGVTNRLANVECIPEEEDTFLPTSITIQECWTKIFHLIQISGSWINKTDDLPAIIELILDNDNRDFIYCNNNISEPYGLKCYFKGEGYIKIKEQYYKHITFSIKDSKREYHSTVYKVKEIDSKKRVKKCHDDGLSNDDEDIIKVLSGSAYFLNKILILISLLLF